ncbi:AFG1-like ATPase-domain-containing protein [Rhodocollybia butyracea]|uniref:AFG1-like ATPase-domain-containing protein n=1 Tax=Rhodocollybia butyracea TaxID=206335 RepID=A0A9P5TWT9_9AGAR|nr:AFG1-like ATPase-domain-containing protein [Rhodocollybia butyracea]
MQLRRLQRDLLNYTPIGLSNLSHWNNNPDVDPQSEAQSEPWWTSFNNKAKDNPSSLILFKGHAEELASLQSPKGLLLTGPPGSGKTFLVDLWFSALPTPYKTRKHYNQLVLEIYRAVWEITQERMAETTAVSSPIWKRQPFAILRTMVPGYGPTTKYSDPPMSFEIAKRLVRQHWLLVFDEIQLLDVSSATLLADVLSWFWRLGGVVIGTSNKVPQDLYQNGVQRDKLEPFVEALKARCPVVTLESKDDASRDWRVVRADGIQGTWFLMNEPGFDDAVAPLSEEINQGQSVQLSVFGRPLHVPWATTRTCRFSFDQLCAEELGSADYLTLSSTFETLILDNVPVLHMSAKDQARRFISLIDALYEARCRLIVRAQALPEAIFFPDAAQVQYAHEHDIMMSESVAETADVYRPNVSSYDAPNMEEAPATRALPLDTLSIFSGQDEQFAFKRALSRIVEMTSPSYSREETWAPLPPALRRWEHSSDPDQPNGRVNSSLVTTKNPPSSPATQPHEGKSNEDNLSIDANHRLSRVTRSPPRLREHHIWGVREDWGEGAGKWGKGAKAYGISHNSDSKPS